ncbi:MAG: PEP-CTERM sorting domain-containing protein [Verrucomicrobiota bacterium]
MKYKNNFLKIVACLSLSILSAQDLTATVITYAGEQTNLGDGWRTPGTAKTQDADGDNIYGTDGYLMYYTGFTGSTFDFDFDVNFNASNALPSYVSITSDGADGSLAASDFVDIDDPNNAPADFTSGVALANGLALGSEASLFNLTFNGLAPSTGVRVGVLVNNTPDRNPAAVRFTLDSDGAVSSSTATNPGVGGQADYYFFDITDISDGDTFSFFATEDILDSETGGEVRVGGFTFDTIAIPEPSTYALLALGSILLFGLRRSKR